MNNSYLEGRGPKRNLAHQPPQLSKDPGAMSLFSHSHNVVISGQNVMMNAVSGPQVVDRGFDVICQNATPSALYGSSTTGKDPVCLPGTRGNVQDHIFKWLDDLEGEVAMWMYGPAGIGKTALAQTIAKLCAEQEKLTSAFFFFRSDDGRNSVKHLVATLAFEMVQQMPHTHDIVCAPIAKNPLLFSFPLERQIKTIILPALLESVYPPRNSPGSPMLIIIDGLDECHETEAQQIIIQSFISLLAPTTTAIRHKILLVSRPESHIISTFSAPNISSHVRHLCLDEWNSIADIEIYLRAELDAVKQTHPLKSYLDAGWPPDDLFCGLLNKSLESFAYATSAIRYIASHDRHPEASLNNLLELNPVYTRAAHAELDALYRHILDSLDEKTRLTVLKVFCLRSLNPLQAHIEIIGSILAEETFALELTIRKVSSVIRFNGQSRCWYYYHTSFLDFLEDKLRSGVLCIFSPMVANTVAELLISALFTKSAEVGREVMSVLLDIGRAPVEIQIHILEALHPSRLPTTGAKLQLKSYLNDICRAIERGLRRRHGPDGFEKLAMWLRSQVVPWNLSTVLGICFGFDIRTQRRVPTVNIRLPSLRLLRDIVNFSNDPWRTIRRFVPDNENWELSSAMVDIYLNVEHWQRMMHRISTSGSHELRMEPLHTIVEHILQSEPVNAQICYKLEKCILDAEEISGSPTNRTPRELIEHYLCPDRRKSIDGKPRREELGSCGCAVIARCMDLYIRKTHSEIDFPYVSEDVRELYIATPSVTSIWMATHVEVDVWRD